MYTRAEGSQSSLYWRVKGTIGGAVTTWANSSFLMPEAIDAQVAQSMLDTLPDVIYKKDFSSANGGESNLNKVYRMAGSEIDNVNMELVFASNNMYTASVQDAYLDINFGSMLQVQRPVGMKAIDYREILRTLMAESDATPSVGAVKAVIRSMFGVDPTITLIRSEINMSVADATCTPPVLPFYVPDTSSPPVLAGTVWSDAELAHGVILTINNPTSAPITLAFVEGIVNKIVPAFSPVYLTGI
jgi:hypothetical protein